MGNITKNQHYVPRLLIRNFAEKDKVWTYDSSRDLLRTAKPEGVFAENYYYDRDNLVENFLCTVESLAAPKIDRILEEPTSRIESPEVDLLRFITVQQGRTPGAYANARDNLKSYTDSFIRQQFEILGVDKKEYEGLTISLKDEKDLLRVAAVGSALNWPVIRDLKPHVLINKTPSDFVISDNPVVFYNWYLREEGGMWATGLTKLGVHIFLPISNRVMLTLFDSRTYKVGEGRNDFTYLNCIDDVKLLNSLQFRNRVSSIIFTSASQESCVREGCAKFSPSSLFKNNSGTTEPVPIGGGKLSAQHFVWRTQLKLNSWLSIVKVKRKASKLINRNQDRDPQFVADFEFLRKNWHIVEAHNSGSPIITKSS